MIRPFSAICLACLLPLHAAFAEAPVVDQSENYAMLDDQEAAMEQPLVRKHKSNKAYDEDIPLVQDNDPNAAEESDPLTKIKDMQQEIRELRGQLEVQAHELSLLKNQQLAFYKDIDARLRNGSPKPTLSQSAPPLTIGAPESKETMIPGTPPPLPNNNLPTNKTSFNALPSGHANPADEQISYLAAYDLIKTKHFDEAMLAMQAFTAKYPKGGYTANAQYWLGELYMVKKNYKEAISHFEIVLRDFPSSSKAAACSLKIGYALAASGNKPEAKQRLRQVMKNYPDTPTAELAATKLQSLSFS